MAYTIVGVTASEYTGFLRVITPDLYVPITMMNLTNPAAGDLLASRNLHSIFVRARLREGATLASAETVGSAVTAQLQEAHPSIWSADSRFAMIPTSQIILFPAIDRLLTPVAVMLMVMAGLVLVITCANLAGFLLARAVDRRKEVTVRLALGATRGRLIAQLLTEALLLSVVGGLAGVLLGRAVLGAILATRLPIPIQLSLHLPLDARVIAFSIGLTLVAGILFGLAPALHGTRPDLAGVIRDESVSGGGRQRHRLRHLLVSGQLALSVVLLVTAGLFMRSLAVARDIAPGFGRVPTGVLSVLLPSVRGEEGLRQSVERIEADLSALPGMAAVGVAANLHLNPLNMTFDDVRVVGVEPPPGRKAHSVDATNIDIGFLDASGITLRSGRNFTAADGPDAPRVVLVNEAFVQRFFPERPALGNVISIGADSAVMMVGVVETARIRSLGEPPTPFMYRPFAQNTGGEVWILGRLSSTPGDAEAMALRMLETVRRVDPDAFVTEVRSMEQHIEQQAFPLRLGAMAIGGFASLALLLACIGLFGMVSCTVAQRTREVGIRLSLGADARDVVRLLLRQGLRLVALGAIGGVILALAASRLLHGLLFGVPILDPLTFGAVLVTLGLMAGLAAYLPARRAGTIDPASALRAD